MVRAPVITQFDPPPAPPDPRLDSDGTIRVRAHGNIPDHEWLATLGADGVVRDDDETDAELRTRAVARLRTLE